MSHPLVLAIAFPLGGLLWWRRRPVGAGATTRTGTARKADKLAAQLAAREGSTGRARQALALLALLLLLRCMLDTWDTAYYLLPFLLALTAWEGVGERGLPALALASTVLAWIDFEWLPTHASADAQAALFLLWTVPLAAALALRLYAPGALEALARPAGASAQALTRRRSAPWAAR